MMSPSSTSIKTSELDPLEAPLAGNNSTEDLLSLEPADADVLVGEGSRRVALGSLIAGTPTPLTEQTQGVETTSDSIASARVETNEVGTEVRLLHRWIRE